MAWQHWIRHWLSMGDKNSRHEDLDDELMFHFRQLVEDKLATGCSFDEAWKEAERLFGPVRRHEIECLREEFSQKRARRPATLIVTCALVVVGGFWFTQGWRRNQLELAAKQADLANEKIKAADSLTKNPSAGARVPLLGTVVDIEDRPIEGAQLLLIVKTWPNGRYQQASHHSETGMDGTFHIENIIPKNDRHAVLVAAVKEGYAFRSIYRIKENGHWEPVRLVLEPASTITLEVHDEKDQPIANARVFPSERRSRAGETNLIYFMGSEPIHATTDADGKVPLNFFAAGDQAEVYVQFPGEEWQNRKIEIPTNGNFIRISARAAKLEWRNLSQK
ncbi:MAG: hypothetical protein U1D30_04400 [Planctomycetota bacterium]